MSSGGYRPGAGRPNEGKGKRAQKEIPTSETDKQQTEKPPEESTDLLPLDYMLKVMNDATADESRRDRMAIAAAPFLHGRKGEGAGKKNEKDEKAKAAATGRFASSPPPLKVVK